MFQEALDLGAELMAVATFAVEKIVSLTLCDLQGAFDQVEDLLLVTHRRTLPSPVDP